jgi:hypothetical protein
MFFQRNRQLSVKMQPFALMRAQHPTFERTARHQLSLSGRRCLALEADGDARERANVPAVLQQPQGSHLPKS